MIAEAESQIDSMSSNPCYAGLEEHSRAEILIFFFICAGGQNHNIACQIIFIVFSSLITGLKYEWEIIITDRLKCKANSRDFFMSFQLLVF